MDDLAHIKIAIKHPMVAKLRFPQENLIGSNVAISPSSDYIYFLGLNPPTMEFRKTTSDLFYHTTSSRPEFQSLNNAVAK